jgi:hypothetical protein
MTLTTQGRKNGSETVALILRNAAAMTTTTRLVGAAAMGKAPAVGRQLSRFSCSTHGALL